MVRSRGTSRSRTPTPTTPPPTSIPKPPPDSSIRKKISALRRGNVKTSSTTAASSIGSSSLNKSHPPLSNEQNATHTVGQGSSSHQAADSAWQTAYSTARMIIGFAKESSDMFLPLKAVVGALSVFITNYDRTVSNTRQIGEIEERVSSLSCILRSPLRENDDSERTRRDLLCRRLVDILERMEPLSEQHGLLRFSRNEDHAGLLNGFVQDIAQAITDYQTSLQQSTYENTKDIHEVSMDIHKISSLQLGISRNTDKETKGIAETTADIVHKAREIIDAADLETLGELNPVRDAGYRAEHHERCLSGTRESILGEIMRWAQNDQDQPVYWLNGLAGTGKSTIAQTFSKMASDRDLVGASFFCSRDYSNRKALKNIFPTLAYQLACHYPRFKDHLVKVIKQDPSVAHNSLISQLSDLLVDPLSATGISCVIVIDALDECVDDQPASAILSVLGRLVSKLPLVKFFITGRPEPRIRSGFRLPLLEPFTQVFLLHEVEPTSVGGDIQLYLTEKLTGIAKRRSGLDLPEVWPLDEDIAVLVKKSSGLFIFASTVARFIESEHHDPMERLRLIVSKADDTTHEGASGIDSLYSQVLRDAFFGIEEESVFVDLKRILSAVVLALDPLSRDGLVKLLNINSTTISTRLRHLHSVILVPTDGSKEIRVFHKSFPDFLQEPNRCRDSRFHIDCQQRHGDMALSCLRLVGKLKMNPCGLPPFVMNEDVSDRTQRMDELGSGLRYACKYWSTHLSLSSSSGEHSDRLVASTSLFFDYAVFPWMEVMSLEGHLEGVIHSMNHLSDRLRTVHTADNSLRNLTNDCLRFTLHFFRPVQLSSQHIYHTALPLSPETSILRLRFFENHPSWKEDLTTQQASSSGIPTTWGKILRTIKADSGGFTQMAVAGERIVAVCRDNTVNVYDAITGVLKLSLKPPQKVTKAEGSPDGSILFFAHPHAREITVWDTQTGGLVHTFTTTSQISDIVVSSKGKYLGSYSSDGTSEFWGVESRRRRSYTFNQAIVDACWLEPEDQVALAFERSVVILEVTTGRMLHTCPVGVGLRRIAVSARRDQLAILSTYGGQESGVQTFDIRSDCLPTSYKIRDAASSITFSDDGRRIICLLDTGGLVSYTPGTPYDLNRHLSNLGEIHSTRLLRSGHLVVSSGESIQLLELEYTRPSEASRHLEITHVWSLDTDKGICGSSNHYQLVNFLDMATMKTLHTHIDIPSSLLFGFTDPDLVTAHFRYWGDLKRHWLRFKTSRAVPDPVLSGTLSPDGRYLAIVGGEDSGGGGDWKLWVGERAYNYNETTFIQKGRPPTKIVFTSGNRFYTEGHQAFPAPPRDEDEGDCEDQVPNATPKAWSIPGTRSIPRTTVSEQPEVLRASSRIRRPGPDEATTSTTKSEGQPCAGVRHKEYRVRKTFSIESRLGRIEIEEVPGEEILPARPYSLDENLEWVVDTRSRRVCWLPPGYVTGIEDGHFFVGSSIVTAGRDGVVRKLTFREPRSDS